MGVGVGVGVGGLGFGRWSGGGLVAEVHGGGEGWVVSGREGVGVFFDTSQCL